jgi:uncharacterized repeat protein (TIGR02543 family)
VLDGKGDNHVDNPPNYNVESPDFTLQDPTPKGSFRFGGWYDDVACEDPADTTIPKGSTGERTFYAQWIRRHTITFNTHGGSGDGSFTYDVGTPVARPDNPELGNHRFLGWFDQEAAGGNEYKTWPYTLNADITMHAQWKKIHKVIFHPNNGSPAPDPQYIVEGDKADDPGDMIGTVAGLYTGPINVDSLTATFDGWHNDPDCEVNLWDFEDPVTGPLDLYAKWTAEPVDIDDQDGDHTLAKALNYIKGLPNLAEKTEFTIVLDGNSETYTMAGVTSFSPNINKANAVITLVGKNPTEISPSSNGSLFRIGAGELVLGNNITLKGGVSTYRLVAVLASSALTMKAGATIHNSAGVNVGGKFNMEGGKIFNNSGGVYVVSGGTFNMRDGEISDNTTTYGGGVYAEGGTFNMSGGKIFNNSVTYYGGGVYVVSGGTFNMSGGEISDNSASENGGGVYVSNGKIEMSNGTISGNSARRGGGVYVTMYVTNTASFSKTGLSVIYGDDDGDPNNGDPTDNTAKDGNTYGHAVYYYNSSPGNYASYYRDTPLNEGDEISTEASKLPANGTDYNWTKK